MTMNHVRNDQKMLFGKQQGLRVCVRGVCGQEREGREELPSYSPCMHASNNKQGAPSYGIESKNREPRKSPTINSPCETSMEETSVEKKWRSA